MGVDVQLFASGNRVPQEPGPEDREQVILFVGRLIEKKGCEVLIRAFGSVARSSPNKVALWIVGDGDDRDALEGLVRELGLSGAVKFFGVQSNEHLPDIYAGADLFVLPSIEDGKWDTEGQGVVLLEAMAGGAPIVESQVGGVEEVIDNNITGLLVKPSDPVLLANRISEYLNSSQLRVEIAQRAKCHVMSYDWPVVARRFVRLYESVSR